MDIWFIDYYETRPGGATPRHAGRYEVHGPFATAKKKAANILRLNKFISGVVIRHEYQKRVGSRD